MEDNLEKFPQKINLNWENLKLEGAKPHERIVLEAIDVLKSKEFDESFLQGYEIRNIIEKRLNDSAQGFDHWQDQLKKNPDAEGTENKLAKGLAEFIEEELNEKQKQAA